MLLPAVDLPKVTRGGSLGKEIARGGRAR